MKRNIIIKSIKRIVIVGVIIFISISGSFISYAEDGLNIETDSLKNNSNNSYKSITDIYKIPLFTESITNEKKEALQKEEDEKAKLNNNLFSKVSQDKDSEEELKKTLENYNLFTAPKEESKIKYLQKQSNINLANISIIVVLSILTAICTTKYYKYKSKKEESYSEYKSYVRS